MSNKVILFFFLKTGIKNLNDTTNIADPKFGIIELDAEYLMESYFKNFKIKYNNFNVYNYFQGFPNINWNYFINQIVKRKKYDYPIKPPLTIGHLIKVAEKGEWFEPE
ncbi:DUF1493 family protein [Apibacter raozihei]|uniref:DUF1493 family protein n=1 Tax=Apibacter raozihei TaxID=2500547 RepID=UPI000FE35D34|nr:DUF1493 family protein [Apibacter raozihei]